MGFNASAELAELGFLSAKEIIAFSAAKLSTVQHVLDYLPRRYEDRRQFAAFPAQATGGSLCLRGVVVDCQRKGGGGRKGVHEVVVGTDDGFSDSTIVLRWFNMPYIAKMLAVGHELVFFGKLKEAAGKLIIDHPDFEIINDMVDASVHVDRIVPIYKNIAGIPQRRVREIIYGFRANLNSDSLRGAYQVDHSYPRVDAYREVHFPENMAQAQAARRFFALEEFFILQLNVAWRKSRYDAQRGRVLGKKTSLLKAFYESLPFDLTGAQKRSVKEIVGDMRRPRPMHRMLQGDVGSGKTFVAMCAALLAIESGAQVALMAPTQILAEQHFLTSCKWLAPLGVQVGLRTSAKKEDEGGAGQAQLLVGTHALLYGEETFEDLGLVIIDEQHKFGVEQRSRLIQKGVMPDVLVMTATPIPRTLTLTIYGDLDVSLLDERPAGRGKVITALRPKAKVSDVTKFVKQQLDVGRQAYLVYPLVEGSESFKAGSATVEFEKWQKRLSKYEVALLHGKVTADEKESVMADFRDGKTDVLVATTVIEVGVDVPNANLMVIYNAERFGLSQLHQLRGRIGRGNHKSYCVLVADGKSSAALEKLQELVQTDDGFKIAEADLRLRGPGDVMGTQQSGLTDLKFIEYLADTDLVREARRLADALLQEDPYLAAHSELLDMMVDDGVRA
ncbi:MAG: ATP-dependent DNA helicase RecG [Rubritalea sp.]|uniref:ATP-dependent DNA helicase RecG n=1 Tax=Rubritalea sp. TaxID=2109375 RepID=UPI003241C842